MRIEKKRLPELIAKKVQSIQESLKHHCCGIYGESCEVRMTEEYGFYNLWIGERLVLSLEGAENFFHALIGFENGLDF